VCREKAVGTTLSPEAFVADRLNESTATAGAGKVHDPGQEPLPDHPYFRLDVSALHHEIGAILQTFQSELQDFQNDDDELLNQRTVIEQGRKIGAPKPLTVTTVGPAGVGKSFLYKALFNRPSITKSSAEGHSCTLYPTKIVLRTDAPDDTTSSDLDIEFFNLATITKMSGNHIRRYHEYYFNSEDNDPADEESRRHASTAKEFIDAALNPNGDSESYAYLLSLLTGENITNGRLLQACVDAIEQRILSAGVGQNRVLSYTRVEDKKLEQIRREADSLAPFVDFLVIKTGGALLRAGLTFIDLPGNTYLYKTAESC
jgi:hypothetical protein